MAFIAHYRGHLHEYTGEFHESMIFQEVTLDDFFTERYPPFLLANFPEQALGDREKEQGELQAATVAGDTLWLWRRTDSSNRTDGSLSEWGGLAVRRAGNFIHVWLVWEEH